jgi:hypothetical protein
MGVKMTKSFGLTPEKTKPTNNLRLSDAETLTINSATTSNHSNILIYIQQYIYIYFFCGAAA